MEENYKLYDNIVATVINDMFNCGEKLCIGGMEGDIPLAKTDYIDPFYWEMMRILQLVSKKEIFIKCGFFEQFKLRKKYPDVKFKRLGRREINFYPNKELDNITEKFNVRDDILNIIYDAYYKKG